MAKKLNKSARIRQMLSNGMTVDQIVEKTKCTKALVYQIRRKMNGDYVDAMVEAANKVKDKAEWKEPYFPAVFTVGDESPIPNCLKSDMVNSPPHYKRNGIEVVDVIEAFELNYRLGNVVKYVLRHIGKGGVEDLKKAQWYLNREISKHE